MKRRRFLAIAAAFAAVPAGVTAAPHRWRGRALGAEAEIVLDGDAVRARAALTEVRAIIVAVEDAFSLFDPGSELSRLNASGRLVASPRFLALCRLAGRVHAASGGLFDPGVQLMWQARFHGRATLAHLGWDRVRIDRGEVRLAAGQALTFNGIAQGYATDLVAAALRKRGFGRILVNVGEFAGYGAPWKIGLADPGQGLLGTRTLRDGAIATSSPAALRLGSQGHILHPRGGGAQWSTVSVEAESAAVADGLSTALCLAPAEMIPTIRARLPGVRRITTVDGEGNLRSF